MEKYKIVGLNPPYKVDLFGMGEVLLDTITDELAEKLLNDGCPYIKPIDEATPKPTPKQTPKATQTKSPE